MRAHYLEAIEATRSLMPRNASSKEIVDFVVQRKKKLEEALKLVNFILTPLKD